MTHVENYFYFRAPADCTQYFTGTTGTIQTYNFAGGQLIAGVDYTNCVRQELGENAFVIINNFCEIP